MKVTITIHQTERYTLSYDGRESTCRNDIVLNAGNLVDAVAFIQRMPNTEVVNIHVNVTDYDHRRTEPAEDGDGE